MKKLLSIIISTLIINTQFFAVLGVGDVVSDPTSYSYYMKQLKAMNDQMEGVFKQIDQLNKINELTQKANDLIFNTGEKIFNPRKRIMGIVNDLKSSISRMKNLSERVKNIGSERFMKEYHNISEPLNDEEFEEWGKQFQALFADGDDKKLQELDAKVQEAVKSGNYKKYEQAVSNFNSYLRIKKIEKDNLTKFSLLAPAKWYNEYYLSKAGKDRRDERMRKIEKYALQINSANDMVKQQKTTNQILMIMIETVDEQYNLQMQFFNAMSILALSKHSMSSSVVSKKELQEASKRIENNEKVKLKEDDLKDKNLNDLMEDLYRKSDTSSTIKFWKTQ